jgi:putative aldouronate transport system permease protein
MGMTRGATRAAVAGPTASAIGRRAELWQQIRRERWMYLFILPGVLYFVVFRYLPLLGNIIAFQDYSPFLGFRGSPFNGLDNFRKLFTDPDVGVAIRNTLIISVLQLLLFFPAPIALALLLNSIFSEPIKRLMQSILYLPHFLSWVIIVALWQQTLGGAGILNQALRSAGHEPINIMANPTFFKPLMGNCQGNWRASWEGECAILGA